ncbi:ADP-forming succinate--CoA ligase subunit beta [Streptomyces violaceorubidus]
MDLYEHQARELFKEHGVVVPRAEVTDSPGRAREIARALGGRAVVKAQVKTGGRGKAGGVRLAADPAEAEEAARQILGMDIKGHTVDTVMVAEPCDIEREFYVSYVLDRARGGFLAIASAEGGMEIEEVAARRPGAVARIPVDPATGVHTATAVRIADAAGLPPQTVDTLVRLWKVLVREDALLVEVNPLVRTVEGRIVALDGKVTLDDNALFRQSRWGEERPAAGDTLEARAGAEGLNYVKLDGEVGVIGNGAGLVMSTLDVVAGCGARPADFLDIGGGASARVMADGLSVILSDPDVKSVLVNVFGGITACDAVADGIVRALDEVRLTKPLVVRLDGNNAARGRALLDARAHPLVEQATTMDGAARRAARLATAASTAG